MEFFGRTDICAFFDIVQ